MKIVGSRPLPFFLPEYGYPFMSNMAWGILDQIHSTWSKVWICKKPLQAKIWYSQPGQEERWIPLNGNQARVAQAAVGHGYLNLTDEKMSDGLIWGLYRMTGAGNKCHEAEYLRRQARSHRQEKWTAHLLCCEGCRELLDPQSARQTADLIEGLAATKITPIIPPDVTPCPSHAPGSYFKTLTNWRGDS